MAAQGASDMVLVVTGGDPVDPAHVPVGVPGMQVVAADSGIEHALALGLRVDVAVGDFDSVDPAALEAVREAGAVADAHPAAKDATDLELAMAVAVGLGARHVHVLGGHGGRLDHLLANALLLAAPAFADVRTTAQMGPARVAVVRSESEATLEGPVGDLVTLLPVRGPAVGVTTSGLLYPLAGEDLAPGTTRGVSNELVAAIATVALSAGVLLAVQPGELGAHHREVTR